MKITTTAIALKQGLRITSGIAKSGTTPILSNILLSKSGESLTFKAADFDLEVKTSVVIGAGDDFSITVPAEKFSKIISALNNDSSVTIDIDDSKMSIKSGRSKLGLQTLPSADFPEMIVDELIAEIDMNQPALKLMLQSVSTSMSQSALKPNLCGVLFEVKDGQLNIVSTDGFRLATNFVLTDSENVYEIIPRNTVFKLIKLLDIGSVKIQFFKGKVRFLIGDTEITSKLHEGKYPDYERVIPKNNDILVNVKKSKFLECIGVATIVLSKSRISIIEVSNELTMTCIFGGETSSDGFDIDYQGEKFEIKFNHDYLKDALNSFESENISIKFNSKDGPILMTDDTNLNVVVMNMKG